MYLLVVGREEGHIIRVSCSGLRVSTTSSCLNPYRMLFCGSPLDISEGRLLSFFLKGLGFRVKSKAFRSTEVSQFGDSSPVNSQPQVFRAPKP